MSTVKIQNYILRILPITMDEKKIEKRRIVLLVVFGCLLDRICHSRLISTKKSQKAVYNKVNYVKIHADHR